MLPWLCPFVLTLVEKEPIVLVGNALYEIRTKGLHVSSARSRTR
jgi:hypothetical protein